MKLWKFLLTHTFKQLIRLTPEKNINSHIARALSNIRLPDDTSKPDDPQVVTGDGVL